MGVSDRLRLSHFDQVEKIGAGARGTVFKAVCARADVPGLRKGQPAAIKILHPGSDPIREMGALCALDHPHIVRFFAACEADSEPWDAAPGLVTEWLDGEDLGRRLSRHPDGLPWDDAQRILLETLEALAYAESRGVLHRDLKPSNLFLCRDGTVKVIDFGLARRTGAAASRGAGSVGGLIGTLDFMAPEFARIDGFKGDVRSDLFSFGCLAWQLVTGRLPFSALGGQPEIAFMRRWTGATPPVPALPRPIAYGWEGAAPFLAGCLNPDRQARFSSFDGARQVLAGVIGRRLAGADETYRLEAFLASGGFCDLYRARGERSGRAVAVKRLHAGRHRWRFEREAGVLETLRQLAHPALVQGIDVAPDGDGTAPPCLILEYLPGPDLRRRLDAARAQGVRLPWPEVAALFVRYLDGLEALHRAGLVHRDLKPANLYAPVGRPAEGRLLDFGIACEQEGTASLQGLPPGTLDYMAPELAVGGSSRGSPQADLFALGCSLFEALIGRLPLARLPSDEVPALRALCARSETESSFRSAWEPMDDPLFDENPGLAAICRRALAFDPRDRYGGADELDGTWSGAGAAAMRQALVRVLDEADAGSSVPAPLDGVAESDPPPTSEGTVTLDAAVRPDSRGRRWMRPVQALLVGLGLLAAVLGRGRGGATPPSVSEPIPPEAPAPPLALPREAAPEPAVAPVAAPEESVIVPEAPVVVPAPVPAEAPPLDPPEAPEPPRTVILPRPPPVGPPPAPTPRPDPAPLVPSIAEPPWDAARIEPLLREAEDGLAARRHWLYTVSDPLRSTVLRRYDPAARLPSGGTPLPYVMPEERHAWPSDLRARYARVRAWEAAADRILDAEAARTLAGVLETAAAGAPAVEAALFRFEQALLRWDGQRVPDPAACASFPEAAFWGAHALAAQGDDQDSRDVMERLVAGVDAGGVVRVEEALLAIRATDHAWARMVRDIRDRTPVEWVVPGTGRAVRDPVGSYGQAVRRVWDLAADDAARLLRVAQATGPEAAEALTRRIRSAGPDPAPGDFVWVCEGLAQTPWREAQAAWTGRPGLTPEERAILDQILGRAPLPAVPDDIPVGRLRDIRR